MINYAMARNQLHHIAPLVSYLLWFSPMPFSHQHGAQYQRVMYDKLSCVYQWTTHFLLVHKWVILCCLSIVVRNDVVTSRQVKLTQGHTGQAQLPCSDFTLTTVGEKRAAIMVVGMDQTGSIICSLLSWEDILCWVTFITSHELTNMVIKVA